MGRRRAVSPWVRLGQRAGAALTELAARGAAWLPRRAADTLGAGFGELAYWMLAGRRHVALANLEVAFGSTLDPGARRALARANFRHLGVTAFECGRLFCGPPGQLLERVQVEGLEHIKAAMTDGRGAFYLTAHFGNWELLAAAHGLAGFPLSVVIRPLDNPFLEAMLARGRERSGLRLIPKRDAVRGVQAALARGECVGLLLDQDAGHDGAFVPFFGELASTSRSLAVLALRTGAAVVPAFLRRLPDGMYRLTLEPAVPIERSAQRHRDIEVNTARFTAVIERHVRAQPDQWFWVHRRWKTRPE